MKHLVKWTTVIFAILLGCLFLPRQLKAQEVDVEGLPASLQDWVPWVLHDVGDRVCARVNDNPTCVWPGELSIELDEAGGSFKQSVLIGARSFHVLPGGPGAWPVELLVGGKSRPVLEREGFPAIELERGSYTIEGRFVWNRVPEILHVGRDTAFLELRVAGTDIPLIKREDGQIWLKGLVSEKGGSALPEQLELQVFRRISDGIPLEIETLLVFQVSGKPREVVFAQPFVSETIPLGVDGDLAVALEPSGALRVQLTPGRHELRLRARTLGVVDQLKSQKRSAPWPEREIWSFHPNSMLRAVEVSGAPGIDASRTDLPEAWRADGAYAVGMEDQLRMSTTRRAEEQIPSNKIELRREFWLDEEANYFTVRDSLRGEMHQNWRLDLIHGQLGQVQVGGEAQVITRGVTSAATGVELRDQNLNLVAISRVQRSSKIAAIGWGEDVDHLSAELRLPPGWSLFAATGVDETSDTWLSRWDLFSVFYVLVLSLTIAKLIHPGAGAVSALALVLCHGESDSPEYLWLPLIVFASLSVLVETGRMKRWLLRGFYFSALVILVVYVSFAVHQVRAALYPHLDMGYRGELDFGGLEELAEVPMAVAPMRPAPSDQDAKMEEPPRAEESGALGPARDEASQVESDDLSLPRSKRKDAGEYGSERLGGGRSSGSAYSLQKRLKPDAVVQTGPGIPEVVGRSWALDWSGPVTRDHHFELYLISPGTERLLTALRLVLVGLMGFFIWRRVHPSGSPPNFAKRSLKSAVVTVGVLLCVLFQVGAAQADEPSDARLEQLKQRLLAAPKCAPSCVTVSSLQLTLDQGLEALAQVHVGAVSAYILPGPAESLSSVRLTVDGKPSTAIRLESDGAYYLRLERGVHEVRLKASLNKDRVTLDVGTEPQKVTVSGSGWTVSGINDLGRVEGGTLTLQRNVEFEGNEDDQEPKSQVAVPPFFTVRRAIGLSVTGQIATTIERLSDASSPEVLKLPLLPGERLTTPGIEVEGSFALIPFPQESRQHRLLSTLTLPSGQTELRLQLSAPKLSATSEVWEIQCGVVWHCETTGIRATSHLQEGHGVWTFHPWPGESLDLIARQPPPAGGTFLTVHNATLTLTPGMRMSRAELVMLIQTSRATVHTVEIPKSARLDLLEVDGAPQSVKSEDGKVRVSLSPGRHNVKVSFREDRGLSTLFRSPVVSTGTLGVNFRTVIDLPEKRWLLMAGGPPQGPAILLWGYLVLIVVAALLLPRLPFAPLKSWEWLLLGLGLTQVPSTVAILVAGWFFAIGSRRNWPPMGRFKHNFLQLCLVAYTVVYLAVLTGAVYEGLVSSPDMDVSGAGSSNSHLVWFKDRSLGKLPSVWTLSLSIWVWRGFMLLWALWLARSLLNWLKWAWTIVSAEVFWSPKIKTAAESNMTAASTDRVPSDEPNPSSIEPDSPADGAEIQDESSSEK